MENTVLTTEIKRITELLRQSTPDKKGELEKKLVELYFEFYRTSAELTTKGDIVNKISQIKIERPSNWSLKVKALEDLQYRRYDVIVTLLDGKKLPKEQVSAGAFYINEKGQKCQKALKVIQVAKPEKKDQKFLGNLAHKIGTGVVNGSNQLIKVTKKTFGKIGEKKRRAKDNAYAFMDVMVAKLMNKMKIGDTITSLEEYQKKTGKDVSDLINFLKKLQTVG